MWRTLMPTLTCQISQSLKNVIGERSRSTGESISYLVSSALSRCFVVPQHTLFQVSTSGALVQGIYERAVSSRFLLNYGDFGLGTFEHLDGEMVVLDGDIYQVRGDGSVQRRRDNFRIPFAVVSRFQPDESFDVGAVDGLDALAQACDPHRESDNLF